MKKEAKDLAVGWAVWVGAWFLTVDDWDSSDILDTISLLVFGAYTLVSLFMTARFGLRLLKAARRRLTSASRSNS